MPDKQQRKQNNRTVGTHYEDLACGYLTSQGLSILMRNFRVRQGEIDIIAKEGDTIVFLEVKYRKNAGAGDPAAAVTYQKQKQICHVSLFYLNKWGYPSNTPCRYDVIAICGEDIRWIKNAFSYF